MNKDFTETDTLMSSIKGCWSCQLFGAVYASCGEIALSFYDKIRPISLNFLGIFLAIWLVFKTVGFATSMRVPNYIKYWTTVLGRFGRALFVAAVLLNANTLLNFVNLIVEPISLMFINVTMSILDNSDSFLIASRSDIGQTFKDNLAFPSIVGTQIENLIYRLQISLDFGRVLGLRMLLVGEITAFILGIFVIVFFILLSLFFPYYFIDAIVRMGFSIILFPLFLVAWVFPYTAQWTLKVWQVFMSAFIELLVGCIFAAIAISVIESYAEIRGYAMMLNPTYQEMNPNAIQSMTKFSIGGLSFLILLLYMFGLSKKTQEIAGFLSGIASSSILAKTINQATIAIKATMYLLVAAVAYLCGLGPVTSWALKKAAAEGIEIAKKTVKEVKK